MTIVDSSVWIDFFNGKATLHTARLIELLRDGEASAGDLIVGELICGFRHDHQLATARKIFNIVPIDSTCGKDLVIAAALRYRSLRRRGVTVRKFIDAVIASYCIEFERPLLFTDSDFRPYVEHEGLISAL